MLFFTVPKHLKGKLLREPEITLKKTIDICQAYEQTANNLREMKESETIERVTQGRNLKKIKKNHLSKVKELQLQEDVIQDQVQTLKAQTVNFVRKDTNLRNQSAQPGGKRVVIVGGEITSK